MRYSDEELEEFRQIIQRKIDRTKRELAFLEHSLKDDQQTHSNSQSKFMEDTAESYERDMNAQLAARLSKFLYNLENAMIRIENKTYGVCKVTGKLISKERLKAVPHTTMSMEAKMNQKR
jgi:RNA polymerase-binding transcription factor DksA